MMLCRRLFIQPAAFFTLFSYFTGFIIHRENDKIIYNTQNLRRGEKEK